MIASAVNCAKIRQVTNQTSKVDSKSENQKNFEFVKLKKKKFA